MNSHLSPLLRGILNDAARLPLATAKRWVPLRECPICRTSDAATQAGSRYCETCLTDGSADANEVIHDGRYGS